MAEQTLSELTGQYSSLSIIGMCKNAGKTTTLNRLIRELNDRGQPPALTSIGRDGESRDVVTATPKPEIYVRRGTLLATAAGLLPYCDITREIVRTTAMSTPLGDVVVLRALSDGFVQLAGPSMNDQLRQVANIFRSLGAEKIIVDGAISRKSLCSREVTEATVLCTGASCNRDMDKVVEETAHACFLLRLPAVEDARLTEAARRSGDRLVYLTQEYQSVTPEKENMPDGAALMRARADIRWLFVSGAVTDSLLSPLIASGGAPRPFSVVARDPSRVLLSRAVLERMQRRGWQVQVLEPVFLAAVTVNPISAYGYVFDKNEFLEKMTRAVDIPVINVEEEPND